MSNPTSTAEEQYIRDLEDAGVIKKDEAAPVEAAPVEEAAPVVENKAAEPAPEATPAPAAPAAPPAEPFEGFNNLPEATRAAILETWQKAAKADEAEKRAQELDRNLKHMQGRVSPVQSRLTKLEADYAKAQKELATFKTTGTQAQSAEAKRKLDEYRKQFPDEADMLETVRQEAQSEIQAMRQQVEELRKANQVTSHNLAIKDELAALNSAVPDWTKKKVKVDQSDDGGYYIKPLVNTPEAADVALWANNLDEFDRNTLWPLLASTKAQDAITFLSRFERDRLWAQSLASQNGSPAQQATPPAPLRAPPDVDPDPTKRASPPASTDAARNESDAERDFAATIQAYRHLLSGQRRAS